MIRSWHRFFASSGTCTNASTGVTRRPGCGKILIVNAFGYEPTPYIELAKHHEWHTLDLRRRAEGGRLGAGHRRRTGRPAIVRGTVKGRGLSAPQAGKDWSASSRGSGSTVRKRNKVVVPE